MRLFAWGWVWVQVVGSPSEDDLNFINSEKARRYIRSLPHHDRVDLQKLFTNSGPLAIDLIDKMLGMTCVVEAP
jgi:hypothetical protein